MAKRMKTKYPGVFYREARRIGKKGAEKVFYIVFKKCGRVIEEKVGRQFADDMTEAKASGIRAERVEGKRISRKELRERKENEQNRWTINRLWDEYKSRRPLNKSLSVDDSRFRNYLQEDIGKKTTLELSQFEVDRLRINLLMSQKKKPQTVKHVLALLKRITNFGVSKQLCDNIKFKIEMPIVNNNKTEDLSSIQLQDLLRAIDQETDIQVANIMKMALYTGMRRGELFRLKWSDIDFEKGFIAINNPKGGIGQKIPLNDSARNVLEIHPRTKSIFIFPDKNGNQRYQITREVNRIKKHAGLPQDFRALHGLRHVYASMLASSGQVDMYTLQKLLTHKSPQMTQRYAHLRDDTLKRASNLVGELVNQAINGEKDKKVVNIDDYKK